MSTTTGLTDPAEPGTRWVSLSQASRILGVSPAALRHWADQGQVRSFRTPGGHRRFAEDDLAALVQAGRVVASKDGLEELRDKALVRIRRRIHTSSGRHDPWYNAMGDNGRDRMRLFGRQLMALVIDSPTRPRSRNALLAEARRIGVAYGREGVAVGLPLRDLLQAFVFFRASLDETARTLVRQEGMTPEQALDLWRHMDSILDGVLLAAAAVYDPPAAAPEAASSS